MKCRNCEADNPNEAALCVKCGSTLPTTPSDRPLVPDSDSDTVTAVVVFVSFFMMVAGGWMIGGATGAGIFFSLLGAVALTVTLVNYYSVRNK